MRLAQLFILLACPQASRRCRFYTAMRNQYSPSILWTIVYKSFAANELALNMLAYERADWCALDISFRNAV